MKPLIRVCNWERRSGKTTFVLSDANMVLKLPNPNNIVLIFSPDLLYSEEVKKVYLREYGSEHIEKERIWFFPSSELKKNGRYFKRDIHIYLDDVNFFATSFEETMLRLNSIGNVVKITFLATEKNLQSTVERAQSIIRNDQEVFEEYGR